MWPIRDGGGGGGGGEDSRQAPTRKTKDAVAGTAARTTEC